MSVEPFRARVTVRMDDLDPNGHVRGPAYLAYADQARWELVRAAGISLEKLHSAGLGPVNLETTVRFHRELRAGDEVIVSCEFEWGSGKTSRVRQELRRADGVLAAEVTGVSGVLDLEVRRLVHDPAERWRSVAELPELLGL